MVRNATGLPPVICLMGPTASGKTDLAVRLVAERPCDIISVDSAMVYRGMDIGTAKPSRQVLEAAPHRLIDIVDPADPYSAGRFRDDALAEIEAITRAGRVPLLVGGTMLYFRSLQQGLAALPDADPAVRAELEAEAARVGWRGLHAELARVDPQAAARIHPNDPQRIQRALEVWRVAGRPLSELQTERAPAALPYHFIKIVLSPTDRAVLHERIALRFRQMLAEGLIDEVETLFQRGDLGPHLPSIRSVGYRQVWDYLAGTSSREEMEYRGVVASRQLAKRQLTWLRSEVGATWLDPADKGAMAAVTAVVDAAQSGGCLR